MHSRAIVVSTAMEYLYWRWSSPEGWCTPQLEEIQVLAMYHDRSGQAARAEKDKHRKKGKVTGKSKRFMGQKESFM